MPYTYDIFGWYSGQGGGKRSTPIAPDNLSTTTTPGQQRANWTGRSWVDRPFVAYEPPTPSVPVPTRVTMCQFRLAMLSKGLLNNVDGAINSMGVIAKAKAKIEWEYSSDLRRDQAFIAKLGGALGLTESEIDNVFITAEKL